MELKSEVCVAVDKTKVLDSNLSLCIQEINTIYSTTLHLIPTVLQRVCIIGKTNAKLCCNHRRINFCKKHFSQNFHYFVKWEGREAACCLAPSSTLCLRQQSRWRRVESPKCGAGKRQLCHFELEFWKLAPMTPMDISATGGSILLISGSGDYRPTKPCISISIRGRAALRGQRAIWLACKKYYPLSGSYHSRAGEQRPVWNPGSSYQANRWLCNDRCLGPGRTRRRRDTLQPQNRSSRTRWTALPTWTKARKSPGLGSSFLWGF